ncbi:unnamed protein product [Clonostachys chloroleuca]|uniref:Uncharacterized protein n=1 Tax=Clonostachys chloroleuca TaxID=1926264 RepID=A0AA35MH01_9HYPO|nr:unnamed protein product [Clonostachys chloroleuca]
MNRHPASSLPARLVPALRIRQHRYLATTARWLGYPQPAAQPRALHPPPLHLLTPHTVPPHLKRQINPRLSPHISGHPAPPPAAPEPLITEESVRPPSLNSRWLSDLRAQAQIRISTEGQGPTVNSARRVLSHLHENWLDLLAGSEGYLVGPRWTGLANQQISWGDMGHVNNVMYNRFAESSRLNYLRGFALASDEEHRQFWLELITPRSIGWILKSIRTEYKCPLFYPDNITVLHRLVNRPDKDTEKILMEAVIISNEKQRVAARCYEELVVYDYRIGQRTNLRPFMVEALQETYDLQEKNRGKTTTHVLKLQESISRPSSQ